MKVRVGCFSPAPTFKTSYIDGMARVMETDKPKSKTRDNVAHASSQYSRRDTINLTAIRAQ